MTARERFKAGLKANGLMKKPIAPEPKVKPIVKQKVKQKVLPKKVVKPKVITTKTLNSKKVKKNINSKKVKNPRGKLFLKKEWKAIEKLLEELNSRELVAVINRSLMELYSKEPSSTVAKTFKLINFNMYISEIEANSKKVKQKVKPIVKQKVKPKVKLPKYIVPLTEEELKERDIAKKERLKAYRIAKRQSMTKEEIEAKKKKDRLFQQNKRKNMSEEEIALYRKKKRDSYNADTEAGREAVAKRKAYLKKYRAEHGDKLNKARALKYKALSEEEKEVIRAKDRGRQSLNKEQRNKKALLRREFLKTIPEWVRREELRVKLRFVVRLSEEEKQSMINERKELKIKLDKILKENHGK